MERGEREDLYISRFMTKLKKFAVVYDISIHLVAHQVTPIVQSGQDYPQPDQYKIKGGGTFSDKADNVVIVWRPLKQSLHDSTLVKIIVSKIKKQRLVGIPGDVDLFYSRSKAQYFENENLTNKELFSNEIVFNQIQPNIEFDIKTETNEPF